MNDETIIRLCKLDCKEKQNAIYLIKLFNNIDNVKKKNLTYKDDFKQDIDRLARLAHHLSDKTEYRISAVSYFERKQYCYLLRESTKMTKEELQDVYSVVSEKLSELYLKLCVVLFYLHKEI